MHNAVPGGHSEWKTFQIRAKAMTWNSGKGGLTVMWWYVVDSSPQSAGRSWPVVLGPQELLAFPTRSFTQDFS